VGDDTVEQATDDNVAHAHCMLCTHTHTYRLCTTYCFSIATVVR